MVHTLGPAVHTIHSVLGSVHNGLIAVLQTVHRLGSLRTSFSPEDVCAVVESCHRDTEPQHNGDLSYTEAT